MSNNPQTAAEYWGQLFDGPKPSPMMLRLNLAAIEFARATTSTRVEGLPDNMALPLLNTDQFMVLVRMYDPDPPETVENVLKIFPERYRTLVITIFYKALGLDFLEPAYFSRKSCQRWMGRMTRGFPDEMHQQFNKMLQSDRVLLDPFTDQEFLFKEIPRSCFPAAPDLELQKFFKDSGTNLEPDIAELNNKIKADMDREAQGHAEAVEQATSIALLAKAQADLRAAEMRATASHGKFYFDSNGHKRYQPGTFDTQQDTNY